MSNRTHSIGGGAWSPLSATVITETGCGEMISAIGLTTQGISVAPVDSFGNPVRTSINWLDSRAAFEASTMANHFGQDALFHTTGRLPRRGLTIPTIRWIRDHEPEVFDRTVMWHLPHSYLTSQMCGRSVVDHSLAAGTIGYDEDALSWSESICEWAGIDPGHLPCHRVGWATSRRAFRGSCCSVGPPAWDSSRGGRPRSEGGRLWCRNHLGHGYRLARYRGSRLCRDRRSTHRSAAAHTSVALCPRRPLGTRRGGAVGGSHGRMVRSPSVGRERPASSSGDRIADWQAKLPPALERFDLFPIWLGPEPPVPPRARE